MRPPIPATSPAANSEMPTSAHATRGATGGGGIDMAPADTPAQGHWNRAQGSTPPASPPAPAWREMLVLLARPPSHLQCRWPFIGASCSKRRAARPFSMPPGMRDVEFSAQGSSLEQADHSRAQRRRDSHCDNPEKTTNTEIWCSSAVVQGVSGGSEMSGSSQLKKSKQKQEAAEASKTPLEMLWGGQPKAGEWADQLKR